jgi:hypothetical protein
MFQFGTLKRIEMGKTLQNREVHPRFTMKHDSVPSFFAQIEFTGWLRIIYGI